MGVERLAGLSSELLPCEVGGGGGWLSVSFHATLDGGGGGGRGWEVGWLEFWAACLVRLGGGGGV